jgi:hypothetical protein
MSVTLWVSPRDVCALMATVRARRAVSLRLAGLLNVRVDSPEVLFAVTTFHRFYDVFFEGCLRRNKEKDLDEHVLVEAPLLVFHLLHALGFCTFLDEDGVERVRLDAAGRPICQWWSDARTALAGKNVSTGNPIAGLLVNTGNKLSRLYKLGASPAALKEMQRRLEELRPKKSSMALGHLRWYDYDENFGRWNRLHEAWMGVIDAVKKLNGAERTAGSKRTREVEAQFDKALSEGKAILAQPTTLPARQKIVASRRSDRDARALLWRNEFNAFIKQEWEPFLNKLAGRSAAEDVLPTVPHFDISQEARPAHRDVCRTLKELECNKTESCSWNEPTRSCLPKSAVVHSMSDSDSDDE